MRSRPSARFAYRRFTGCPDNVYRRSRAAQQYTRPGWRSAPGRARSASSTSRRLDRASGHGSKSALVLIPSEATNISLSTCRAMWLSACCAPSLSLLSRVRQRHEDIVAGADRREPAHALGLGGVGTQRHDVVHPARGVESFVTSHFQCLAATERKRYGEGQGTCVPPRRLAALVTDGRRRGRHRSRRTRRSSHPPSRGIAGRTEPAPSR